VPVEDQQEAVPAEAFDVVLAIHGDDYIGGASAWVL